MEALLGRTEAASGKDQPKQEASQCSRVPAGRPNNRPALTLIVSFEQGCSLDQQQPTPSALLGRECLGESAAIVQAPAE